MLIGRVGKCFQHAIPKFDSTKLVHERPFIQSQDSGGSRINNDRFPKQRKSFYGGPRACSPRNFFGFELSQVPFPVFLTDFRKTVETGMDTPLQDAPAVVTVDMDMIRH